MFLKMLSLDKAFQELLYGMLYFFVAQKIVIFICLGVFGKFVFFEKSRNMEFTELNVLRTIKIDLNKLRL